MTVRNESNNATPERAASEARRLRVLVIAPSLDMLGGQSRQAARLIGRLSEEPSLDVAFLAVNPRLPGGLSKLQDVKYVRTLMTTLWYWATLLRQAGKYDILHVFSASYYSYMLSAMPAILVGKLFGRKTILNYRSGEAEDHLQNWRLTAIPVMRLADVIVTPSGYLVDVFARFGLKARPIFNTVDPDSFQFRNRGSLKPTFLASRLLEPLYNVPCVLRAFALIQKRIPEARLTVAGEGFLRAELEDLARELGLRNTEFIGGVPFEKMPEVHDSADVYLNAPNIDNMPSSIIECLASGLLVVTTDAGGIPYIVSHEETALIVARNDHEAMATAALRLLEDNDLAGGIAARARAHCRKFSWQGVQGEWLALYHELASAEPALGSRRIAGGTAESLSER